MYDSGLRVHTSVCTCMYTCACMCVCVLLYKLIIRETNLKVRQPLPETAELSDNTPMLSGFDGKCVCVCVCCQGTLGKKFKFLVMLKP